MIGALFGLALDRKLDCLMTALIGIRDHILELDPDYA
jgi:hypothetical protein